MIIKKIKLKYLILFSVFCHILFHLSINDNTDIWKQWLEDVNNVQLIADYFHLDDSIFTKIELKIFMNLIKSFFILTDWVEIFGDALEYNVIKYDKLHIYYVYNHNGLTFYFIGLDKIESGKYSIFKNFKGSKHTNIKFNPIINNIYDMVNGDIAHIINEIIIKYHNDKSHPLLINIIGYDWSGSLSMIVSLSLLRYYKKVWKDYTTIILKNITYGSSAEWNNEFKLTYDNYFGSFENNIGYRIENHNDLSIIHQSLLPADLLYIYNNTIIFKYPILTSVVKLLKYFNDGKYDKYHHLLNYIYRLLLIKYDVY